VCRACTLSRTVFAFDRLWGRVYNAPTFFGVQSPGVEDGMDSTMKQLARELSDAVSAALANDARVEACREKARAAGFDMRVSLEAVVTFASRDAAAGAKGSSTRKPGGRFGLEMSARAILYDYLMYDSRYAMKRFNMQGVQLATTLRGTVNARGDKDEGWTLEVAIPWVNFEEISKRPEAGTAWTFNMARWDGVEPDRRMSMYLDPGTPRANPHVPAKFGELVFVK